MVVAGAVDRAGLAVTRSLGRRGVGFVALGHQPNGMVAASRHVRRYLPAPSAADDPDAFVAAVVDAAAKSGARLVIPMDDAALAVCSENRDAFPEGVRLAAAGREAVRNVLDKPRNLETARHCGVPCPAESSLEDVGQPHELIDRLGLPMVLKNPGRAAGTARPANAFKWQIAGDERELRALLDEHAGDDRPPIFQELVEGEVTNLCCFAAAGRLVAVHQYRSVRRQGWAGTTVLREIAATNPRLVAYAGRLLADLKWDGVAQVAFIVRERDGASWYMETNGRFWASVAGSIAVGWDFPYWTYRYFTRGELPTPPPPVIGSRSCWHYGDLSLLGRRLRGIEPPVPPRPGRLRAMADYVTGFGPGVASDVYALDDPLPELVEHWEGLRLALVRRLRR